MKLIAGFDCAIENLGICYILYDEDWRDKLQKQTDRLYTLFDQISVDGGSTISFFTSIYAILKEADSILNNVISIQYFNTFDLIPSYDIKGFPDIERTKRLKHLLNTLDSNLPNPDIVLIEKQMKQNVISNSISYQIAYHYASCDNLIIKHTDRQKKKGKKEREKFSEANNNNTIEYEVNNCQLDTKLNTGNTKTNNCSSVELVGTGIKNSCSFTADGQYDNFILKYSNYTSNKKHTDFNFRYFISVIMPDKKGIFDDILNKTDDIADAFMMIFGWLRKNKLV